MTDDEDHDGNDEHGRICLCGSTIPAGRVALGYWLCLPCGETRARQTKHCIAPLNKSNYIHISDHTLLWQLNPKRTT